MDEAPTPEAALAAIALVESYLDLIYPSPTLPTRPGPKTQLALDTLVAPLPAATRSAFSLLASLPIPRAPLDELVAGFKTDLAFAQGTLPIKTDADLFAYGASVASSVAELCVRLVWAHEGVGRAPTEEDRAAVVAAARRMGVALQLVNICRDVPADKALGRSYLPGFGLDASTAVETAERRRLLQLATDMAREAGPHIDLLPRSASGGIRAACEVYLEIGVAVEAALARGATEIRATVRGRRRAAVAWAAMGRGAWQS